METTTVRLFKNGQSQAVRIPRALEFKGVDEVEIVREGDAIVLRPIRKSWSSFAEEAAAIGATDDDFMRERPFSFDSTRVRF
jgi:antitoxin VapB